MVDVGNPCIDQSIGGGNNGYTTMDLVQPALSSGNITSWCVYIKSGTPQAKIKVFRDDGTNYVFIAESSLETLSGGLNTFSTNLPIQINDLIAIYVTGSHTIAAANYTNGSTFKSGDITSSTLKSSWTTGDGQYSFGATITAGLDNVYVNSSTGNDTYAGDSCVAGHPVLTFAKAYSLVAPDGTIHVCNSGADFSGETVTRNKSYSMTVDGDGYWYDAKAS